MLINKSNRQGITLVEVVVVALLMSVLALGAFSLFMMYTNAQRETAARLKLQRQADMLLDEIARRVRGAGGDNGGVILRATGDNATLPTNAAWSLPANAEPNPPFDGGVTVAAGRVNTVIIRDSTKVLVSFAINNISGGVGIVQIREGATTDDNDWRDFMVDGSRIEVAASRAAPIPADVSWFGVWYGRKQLSVNMILRTQADNGKVFHLNAQKGVFRCRN